MSELLSQLSQDDMSIDSDDDRSGEHHWSRQQTEEAFVGLDPLICSEDNILGSPSMRFIDNATPAHLLGHIFNDNFLNVCVEATWEYGHNDPEFCEQLPFLNVPEDGRLFVKGFFAIKWHLGLINYKQYRWA